MAVARCSVVDVVVVVVVSALLVESVPGTILRHDDDLALYATRAELSDLLMTICRHRRTSYWEYLYPHFYVTTTNATTATSASSVHEWDDPLFATDQCLGFTREAEAVLILQRQLQVTDILSEVPLFLHRNENRPADDLLLLRKLSIPDFLERPPLKRVAEFCSLYGMLPGAAQPTFLEDCVAVQRRVGRWRLRRILALLEAGVLAHVEEEEEGEVSWVARLLAGNVPRHDVDSFETTKKREESSVFLPPPVPPSLTFRQPVDGMISETSDDGTLPLTFVLDPGRGDPTRFGIAKKQDRGGSPSEEHPLSLCLSVDGYEEEEEEEKGSPRWQPRRLMHDCAKTEINDDPANGVLESSTEISVTPNSGWFNLSLELLHRGDRSLSSASICAGAIPKSEVDRSTVCTSLPGFVLPDPLRSEWLAASPNDGCVHLHRSMVDLALRWEKWRAPRAADESVVERPQQQLVGLAWELGSGTGWGVAGEFIAAGALLSNTEKERRYACAAHDEPGSCEERENAAGWIPVPLEQQYLCEMKPLHQHALAPTLAHAASLGRNHRALEWRKVAADGTRLIPLPFPVVHCLGKWGTDGLLDVGSGRFLRGGVTYWGAVNVGLIFFENATWTQEEMTMLSTFDAVIAGSEWNAQVLIGHGADPRTIHTWRQGIDVANFRPVEKEERQRERESPLRIFSGGKLEYRKGQDIVVAAFKELLRRHDASGMSPATRPVLEVAWFNQWHLTLRSLVKSPYVEGQPTAASEVFGGADTARLLFDDWLVASGLPRESVVDLGRLDRLEMAERMRVADVAIFTNRCEGGTNLVAMEALAVGTPVVLSANTGHLDLIASVGGENCIPLLDQRPLSLTHGEAFDGWGESSVDEAVAALEWVRDHRREAELRGRRAAEIIRRDWPWSRTIPAFYRVLDEAHQRWAD